MCINTNPYNRKAYFISPVWNCLSLNLFTNLVFTSYIFHKILSRVYGSVTNNDAFWTGWLGLLTPSLQSPVIAINYNNSQYIFSSVLIWSLSFLVCITTYFSSSLSSTGFWLGSSFCGDWLRSYLNSRLYSVSVPYEIFVDHSYPWTCLLIPQQRVAFQRSTSFIVVSQETCSSTRFLEMGLHVTIFKCFSH
jgi:hypothetical protein